MKKVYYLLITLLLFSLLGLIGAVLPIIFFTKVINPYINYLDKIMNKI